MQHIVSRAGEAESSIAGLPWGAVDPHALTYFVRRHFLEHLVRRREIFYSLEWHGAQRIYRQDDNVTSYFTERTIAVHLWSFTLGELKNALPPEGSSMHDVCKRCGALA